MRLFGESPADETGKTGDSGSHHEQGAGFRNARADSEIQVDWILEAEEAGAARCDSAIEKVDVAAHKVGGDVREGDTGGIIVVRISLVRAAGSATGGCNEVVATADTVSVEAEDIKGGAGKVDRGNSAAGIVDDADHIVVQARIIGDS